MAPYCTALLPAAKSRCSMPQRPIFFYRTCHIVYPKQPDPKSSSLHSAAVSIPRILIQILPSPRQVPHFSRTSNNRKLYNLLLNMEIIRILKNLHFFFAAHSRFPACDVNVCPNMHYWSHALTKNSALYPSVPSKSKRTRKKAANGDRAPDAPRTGLRRG